jgi:hypothetical protein
VIFYLRGTWHFTIPKRNFIADFSYGNSKDWAYGALNITYSYTVELPAGGPNNFDPPPEFIIPVASETWEAIKVFAANIPASRG